MVCFVYNYLCLAIVHWILRRFKKLYYINIYTFVTVYYLLVKENGIKNTVKIVLSEHTKNNYILKINNF